MIVRGAGKGGAAQEAARTPIDAPNTLQSNALARVVDLISEGEIVGLANGLQSVFFDNTPLQNEDGSYNFNGVTVETRVGLPDQSPLSGFPAVETEVAVGVAVTAIAPVTRTLSNISATAARVTLQLAALVSVDSATGDRNPTSVNIAIDVKPSGGVFSQVINDTITGKTSSTYQRAYRVPLSGTGPWDVRVRRNTPDSASDSLVNATTWSSYTAIEDYQFSYPYSALVGISVNAKSFGNQIPKRTYDVLGIKIQVPSNYNPATRAYTGIWNGTFQTAWSDNPAWVFYDLLTSSRYGLGQFIPSASIDKFGLYAIAQYCDELVPDGQGGFEPRYTFNGVISSAAPAMQVLTMLASAFRGMVYWGPSGVMATADRPTDPVKLVTPANVVDGMITYSGAAMKARHTGAFVSWYNPDNNYQQDIEPVEGDPDDIAKFGWRPLEVVAFGCTSRGQAHRFGRWILDSERTETETATWTASWDQADVLPGDIVLVADPAYSGVATFHGRVLSQAGSAGAYTGIVVDRSVTIESGQTYTVSMMLPDGRVVERLLSNSVGSSSTLSFVDTLPDTLVIGSVWLLSSSSVEPRRFRVIARVEKEKHLFEITALLHDPTKYDRIEQGFVIEAPSYTSLPTGPLAAPSHVTVSESITLAGGSVARAKYTVSWTPAADSRVARYEVQQQPPGQDWEPCSPSFSDGVSLDLFDLRSGTPWLFRVRAMDGLGRVSAWATSEPSELLGLLLPPGQVENPRLTYVDDNLSIAWDEVSDYRPHRYALRKGDSWVAALELGTVAHPPFAAHGNGTYWIKAYTGPDSDRVYSVTAASIEVAGVSLSSNVIATRVLDPGWDGVFTGTVAKSGSLIRTGGSSDILSQSDFLNIPSILDLGAQGNGTFEMKAADYISVGRIAPCRVVCTWKGTGGPVGQDILGTPDFLGMPDVLGSVSSDLVSVYPEVSVSQLPGADVYSLDPITNPANDIYAEADVYSQALGFGNWQKYEPGIYVGQRFRARMVLETRDAQTIAYCLAFQFSVDVPDRLDTWGIVSSVGTSLTNITVPPGGLAITFASNGKSTAEAFNGGVGTDPLPHIQITNTNGVNYDFEVTGLTLAGCTIYAKQSASAVSAPKTNIAIQGY